jgi:diguanylate cyclase (GGDEF)-like protein
MKNAFDKHTLITATIKKQIEPLKIVFPSQYGKFYAQWARTHNIELKPDEILGSEMLNEKVVQHVITLASCTEKAIQAIENEDKKTLETVLAETKSLRDEINELQRIIYEDTLTKCYNRKWFEDMYLDNDNLTLNTNGTLAIIDLNKFKIINDTFGHTIGDKVLVHIANTLKETGGKVIRYGGDEFLVIFDDTQTFSEIQKNFDEMIIACAKKSFKVEEESFKVSFAYGTAPFTQGDDLNTIIDIADKAMYRHKKGD